MRRLAVLGLVLVAAACQPSPPTAPAAVRSATPPLSSPSVTPASPSAPSQPAPLYAVMIHMNGDPYLIDIVRADGVQVASASAARRSGLLYWLPSTLCPPQCATGYSAPDLPEISISTSRVYFLDGDTTVKSLMPDGTVATVLKIAAPPNSEVAFAVSPDDTRIAVAVITLATTNAVASFHEVMYVEKLDGSGRVDIFSTTTRDEWPVGWHRGDLVVAVGPVGVFGASFTNPYGAIGYHVVDPATGVRHFAMDCAWGLLVPSGSACASGWCSTWTTCSGGTLGMESWAGTRRAFPLASRPPPRIFLAFQTGVSLSPDGTRIIATVVADPVAGVMNAVMFGPAGESVVAPGVTPQGWLDDSHLVVGTVSEVSIVDVTTGNAVPMSGLSVIPQQGMPLLAGVLPQDFG